MRSAAWLRELWYIIAAVLAAEVVLVVAAKTTHDAHDFSSRSGLVASVVPTFPRGFGPGLGRLFKRAQWKLAAPLLYRSADAL